MKQIQTQSVIQRLALTQQMRNSLHMLKMGPDELIEAAEQEAKRNPFLRLRPRINAMENTVKSSVEFHTRDIADCKELLHHAIPHLGAAVTAHHIRNLP